MPVMHISIKSHRGCFHHISVRETFLVQDFFLDHQIWSRRLWWWTVNFTPHLLILYADHIIQFTPERWLPASHMWYLPACITRSCWLLFAIISTTSTSGSVEKRLCCFHLFNPSLTSSNCSSPCQKSDQMNTYLAEKALSLKQHSVFNSI